MIATVGAVESVFSDPVGTHVALPSLGAVVLYAVDCRPRPAATYQCHRSY